MPPTHSVMSMLGDSSFSTARALRLGLMLALRRVGDGVGCVDVVVKGMVSSGQQ